MNPTQEKMTATDPNQNQHDHNAPEPIKTNGYDHGLETIDGETLMTAAFPLPQFVVEGLLPTGLHLLAGAPKAGKSWLVLWLCLQVAKGEVVWNFPVRQGWVLYLALEDSLARLQWRSLAITDTVPDCCEFAVKAGDIHGSLAGQIRAFVSSRPDTRLVVIDTLQKVRDLQTDRPSYAGDYRDLTMLKDLADELAIAILLVHHLRKEGDEDPVNRISGTTGISGAVDSSFTLIQDKRGEKTATLQCCGRDIEDRKLRLEFDRTAKVWMLLEDSVAEPEKFLDPTAARVLAYVKTVTLFRGTVTELMEAVGNPEALQPNAFSNRIMKDRRELERQGVVYQPHQRTRDRREISLTYVAGDGSDGCDADEVCGDALETVSVHQQEVRSGC